jgi:RNA polymerase sigma-70 factor, ECF subfamily
MADFPQPPSDPTFRVDEFMRLYTQHQRRLYVYLLSLVHNVADAEELLQESSYVLWRKFDEFRPESNFGAWACRVAYFEVLKFRERRQQGEVPLSPQFLERVAGKMAEVSDLLELRSETFNYCMDRLSEADRELITRRYAPGASVKRIAAALNRPVRSVSKSLARIRRLLIECIDRRRRQEERP